MLILIIIPVLTTSSSFKVVATGLNVNTKKLYAVYFRAGGSGKMGRGGRGSS